MFRLELYTKKRGASSIARSTIWRLSHCPICRNEQRAKAPRRWMYIKSPFPTKDNESNADRRIYMTIHPNGASPLLCSWQIVVNLRDSQIVKTKAYSYAFMYMCPFKGNPFVGFSLFGHCKNTIIFWNSMLFRAKKWKEAWKRSVFSFLLVKNYLFE